MRSLFQEARRCIECATVDGKLRLTRRLARDWQEGRLCPETTSEPLPINVPGRPPRPLLVAPSQLAARRLSNVAGRAALLHALAHIEFNAINLAWDAVYRFRDMPAAFYDDWIEIAAEEAGHFALLRRCLEGLGCDYGDYPAHDGLWDMARRTAHDVLARMALVPRALEARGLDVTPGMITRLQQAGDPESAGALESILRDEIGHVAVGTCWFQYICRQRELEPLDTYRRLLAEFLPGPVRGPLNRRARQQAGFSRDELDLLEELSQEASC